MKTTSIVRLCELIELKGWTVEHDIAPGSPSITRLIEFQGEGWYSLDSDRNMFVQGKFPTFSRIRIIAVK